VKPSRHSSSTDSQVEPFHWYAVTGTCVNLESSISSLAPLPGALPLGAPLPGALPLGAPLPGAPLLPPQQSQQSKVPCMPCGIFHQPFEEKV
jgi:hypothetical protein